LGSHHRPPEQLRLSTARVSEMVRNLEERLGVRLVERTTRSVASTTAGERLLERLRPALVSCRRSAKHRVRRCTAILAWRRSGRAVLHAIGDFAPLQARQVKGCVVQPLPNSHEARFEPRFKAEAAGERQSDHRLVGPQRIAEEEFDTVGRRFAFDFVEHGRAGAKMAPVI
jgi:hypothetical protein